MSRYKPFISEGVVTLNSNSGDAQPDSIEIVRDTGATQSLILESILPFSEDSATGSSAIKVLNRVVLLCHFVHSN